MMTERTTHATFLSHLSTLRTADDVVVATMTAGMTWPFHSKEAMDISFMAPMGAASPMGLGIALARPDLGVNVLDADGSLLMSLGSLVTIGGVRPARFLHVLFENGVYDITGGIPLPGTGTEAVPAFAASAGYTRTLRSADHDDLERAVADMHDGAGPILLAVPVGRDFVPANLAAEAKSPQAVQRLGRTGFHNLREQIRRHDVVG
jgi:phosphonopyruvate decarboxylase